MNLNQYPLHASSLVTHLFARGMKQHRIKLFALAISTLFVLFWSPQTLISSMSTFFWGLLEDLSMDMLRRQFMEVLAKLGLAASFGDIGLALVSSPTVEPQEYLSLVGESIDTWWQWLNQGNFNKLERVLLTNVPILKRLANTISSPFQSKAANLTVRAKIMQTVLAIHKFDFLECETHCTEAVHFGRLSGNHTVLAVALDWQGSTYIYCYRDPQRAIALFDDALMHLGSNDLLNRSSIYINLSVAYAQKGDEIQALKYANMARKAMPTHPELDPFYPWLGIGPSELDQFEGKMHLHLAEYFPKSDYAQLAYDVCKKSISKQATDKDYPCGSLIKKADAARALGNMNGFVEDLTKGFRIGVEIDSIRRLNEALAVIGRIPEKWQKENSIQNLHKDISHALIVVRR